MSGEKAAKKTPRIKINDAEEWPELESEDVRVVAVEVEAPTARIRTAERFAILFGLLFSAYIAHAMWVDDQDILNEGFEVVKIGLTAAISWTYGRRSALPRDERNSQSQEGPPHR